MEPNLAFQQAPWWRWHIGDTDIVHKEPLSACEVEVESEYHTSSSIHDILRRTPENRWQVVDEGSLRGGFELVSIAPLPTSELKLSLAQIAPAFEGIQDTFRAAVHVHCNVQYFNREQYMKALVAYYLLEPSFYTFSGEGRDESVFCVPWYKGNDHIHKIARAYYSNDATEWATSIRQSPKYSGLNLRATSVYGSLEFRHMPTPTTDSVRALQRISRYIDKCNKVIELAMDTRFSGTGMLEFADWVISRSAGIPMEHLCNVYSAIAIERPLDKLVDGIASSTVLNTVDTTPARRGPRRTPRVMRRPRRSSLSGGVYANVDFGEPEIAVDFSAPPADTMPYTDWVTSQVALMSNTIEEEV